MYDRNAHFGGHDRAIVLLSGGMRLNSTATIALQESKKVSALHLNYRHRTERRELRAFQEVCDALEISERLIVDIEFLRTIGGSSLTDNSIDVTNANLEATTIPTSYVPFRNGNFLSIAASWAEVIGADSIYIGAVEVLRIPRLPPHVFQCLRARDRTWHQARNEDPDTDPDHPIAKERNRERVAAAGAPIERTWSCYQSEDVACGVCDSCALRLRGFAEVGMEDPIPYKVRPQYV